MDKPIKRYNPDINVGLINSEINERINDNLINYDTTVKTKSIKHIISNNVFTLFNLLNICLAIAIIFVKSYKNLLFMGVVISNIIISTFQEIMAKKTIDKLSLINESKAKALRDGKIVKVDINQIVLDDILILSLGNQVICDSKIMCGECEVDESFITGESKPIFKKIGDTLLSGSFIMSGNIKAKVEHIGLDNYTSSITNDAKYIKNNNSVILKSLKKVIKVISISIIPISILLFYNQINLDGNTIIDAVVNTVAALIGMIPEGLILLTSTVFAVSIIRLSKYNVLIQDLYCSESLARVDTLCLDKTGTITESNMELVNIINIDNTSINDIKLGLNILSTNLEDSSPTMLAIKNKYNKATDYIAKHIIPFSSRTKWSLVNVIDGYSYILGSPEFILGNKLKTINKYLSLYENDYRVLLLAKSKNEPIKNNLPKNIEPMALILIRDKIREEAKETIKYFEKQNVDIKIISGDNVKTVSNIAKRVGLKAYNDYIDVSTLKSYDEICSAVDEYSIFGRVSPRQKKQIVLALKDSGHVVGMTGDGVNDCLALKEADCSIAMANGSDAARNVSQIVLLDSNFDTLPKILKEGRRSINNLERSATLFLVKTIYATLLALMFLFINMSYPFEPIQLTLTSALTIGIPSFVLALEKNSKLVRGNFLMNVVKKALPTALTIVTNIIVIMVVSHILKLSQDQMSTLCVILTGYTGFILLYHLCYPFNLIRGTLLITLMTLFVGGIIGFRTLFSLTFITPYMLIIMLILMFISIVNYKNITIFTNYLIHKYRNKFFNI